MKKIILLLPALLSFNANAQDDFFTCTVTRVVDGDTIHCKDDAGFDNKIRFAYIDAPELKQKYGEEAKKYVFGKIFLKRVFVDYSAKDRYSRIIGKITYVDEDTGGAVDLNKVMVATGNAWAYEQYIPTAALKREYAAAQREAQEKRLGLWKDYSPAEPWEFRKLK